MKRKSVTLETASISLGSSIPNSESPHPPHEEIARLAYSYWEERAAGPVHPRRIGIGLNMRFSSAQKLLHVLEKRKSEHRPLQKPVWEGPL